MKSEQVAGFVSESMAGFIGIRNEWQAVQMIDLVGTTVKPFNEAEGKSFTFFGAEVVVPAKAALAFGMAINELCTNAAKYGAISVWDGRVAIRWSVNEAPEDGEPTLEFRWMEEGGPPVQPPERSGFGSKMIERALAAELGANVVLSYPVTGVVFAINAPFNRFNRASEISGF